MTAQEVIARALHHDYPGIPETETPCGVCAQRAEAVLAALVREGWTVEKREGNDGR